jgi:pyruvate/2-oxoglutarate dehydrogenase complex dihydrolipoamide dehydrogenase (E3) component
MTQATEDRDEQRLLAHVRPPAWRNPEPAAQYDLVVIGGGTAGLVSAVGAANLGARVALVERARLGGDCLNAGCVPSKALLRAARVVREARSAASLGVRVSVDIDFEQVMARVRAAREAIAPHDSAGRVTSLGVEVFFGQAAFASDRTIAVEGAILRFRRAVIATGSHPVVPSLRGLAPAACLTTDTLFELREPPRSLLVVGAGPVGCEMAQAFALLGTNVTLIEAAGRVLPGGDPDASSIIARALAQSGVTIVTGASIDAVSHAAGAVSVMLPTGTFTADRVLVAAGRRASISALEPATAGVEANADGIVVDDQLRTTNRRIFAAGDVCSSLRYTHAADAMARIVIQNALFFGRKRVSSLIIPGCTFTFPEAAHVGAPTGVDSADETITVRLDDVDRAIVDAESEGFVRIRHSRGRIRGVTMVAPHAGDAIGHIASAMQAGATLGDLSRAIFVYPTVSEAWRKAGDAYRRGSLTPGIRRWLGRYFALSRR